jgi:hypothetical protein
MAYLPNRYHAFVDIRKLENYVLNLHHDRGKHKAKVFASTFGLNTNDAEELREYILEAVKTFEAQFVEEGEFGYQYKMDFPLNWNGVTKNIRTTWIVRHGEDFPRLVSCFVKGRGKDERN